MGLHTAFHMGPWPHSIRLTFLWEIPLKNSYLPSIVFKNIPLYNILTIFSSFQVNKQSQIENIDSSTQITTPSVQGLKTTLYSLQNIFTHMYTHAYTYTLTHTHTYIYILILYTYTIYTGFVSGLEKSLNFDLDLEKSLILIFP